MYMYIDVGTRTRDITNIIDGTVCSRQTWSAWIIGKTLANAWF